MVKNEIIYANDSTKTLLPKKLVVKFEPCSFKGNNNMCPLNFAIDDNVTKNGDFFLSVSADKNTVIVVDRNSADQSTNQKENLFFHSAIEIKELMKNTMHVRLSSTYLTYNLELVRN